MKNKLYKQLIQDGWQEGQPLLLAVSAGIDSMFLCSLAEELKLNYALIHVNFQLRGRESDEDQIFIEEWAERHGVKLFVKSVNTLGKAQELGISTQMAAREIRYAWFEEIRLQQQYDFVCTAHHLNDSLETLLINLDRGTGIHGLTGIQSQTTVLRPLQSISRPEIEAFIAENKIAFREDSSNESLKYERNWFRHVLVKEWMKHNASLMPTMRKNLKRLNRAAKAYDWAISEDIKQCSSELESSQVKLTSIAELKFPEDSLYALLQQFGFNEEQVAELLAAIALNRVGAQWSVKSFRLSLDRELLILEEIKAKKIIEEKIDILKYQYLLEEPFRMNFSLVDLSDFRPGADAGVEFFDFDALKFPLQLRKWKAGDSMLPLGMQGRKKVSDILIDAKVSLPQKENTWVLESDGEIIWLIGHCISDKTKVKSGCKQVYRVEQMIDIAV